MRRKKKAVVEVELDLGLPFYELVEVSPGKYRVLRGRVSALGNDYLEVSHEKWCVHALFSEIGVTLFPTYPLAMAAAAQRRLLRP